MVLTPSLLLLLLVFAFVIGLGASTIWRKAYSRLQSGNTTDPGQLKQRFGYRQIREQTALVNAIADIVIGLDRNSIIVAWTAGAEALYGFTPTEAIGRTVDELLKTEPADTISQNAAQALKNSGVWRQVVRRHNRAGQPLQVLTTLSVRRNAHGEIIGYLLIEHDNTAEAQSAEAIRRSEENLRRLFAANPLAMWIYDPETLEILDVNDAAITQYGYSRAKFLQMRLTDLHPPDYTTPVHKHAEPAASSIDLGSWRDGGQWRHMLHDGRVIDVHILAHTTEFSGRPAHFMASQNITAQVQAEAELRTREAWWRAVIEHDADMILVVDANQKFVYVSPSVRQILGYEPDEIVGSDGIAWLDSVDDRSPILHRWWEQSRTGNWANTDEYGIPFELRVRDKAGQWHWLELIFTPLNVASLQGVIINAREITARVEAEQSLFAANENLTALIESAPTPIIAQDRNQRVTVWNPAAEKLFGWREAEVLGQPNPIVFSPLPLSTEVPSDLSEGSERDIPPLERHSGRMVRMSTARRDQSQITVSVSTGFIRDNAAQINGTISVLVDMTAQQNAQNKMLQQNEYLIALHDTALALLNRLDVDQLLSAILHKASTFLNTPDGYLGTFDPLTNRVVLRVGMGFYNQHIGKSVASTDGLVGQVLSSKRLYVIDDYSGWARQLNLVPGTHLYAAIGMPLTASGQVIGVIGLVRLTPDPFTLDEIAQLGQLVELACLALDNAQLYAAAQQDLAKRSRAETALQQLNTELEARIQARTVQLQQREVELRTVLDSMSEGLIYFQTDLKVSRIEYANEAIAEMVGFRAADLAGQSFAIFDPVVSGDSKIKPDIIKLASNGGVWRNEASWRRPDGSRVLVALSVRRVQSSVDNVLRGVMIARDITAERQLTDQKMRFIANASHELRTPLTHLKTRMYLIRRQPERAAEHLAVLEQSITRMTRLVEDMLDTTRFEHGWGDLDRRQVIIQDLINELLSNIQPEIELKKIELTVDQPDQPVALPADSDRLMQVLNNLAANAINYTPDGGRVCICVRSDEQAVVIEIEDSGVGVASENFERVFEPFFRVELGTGRGISLGLGLSISREIVLLHGGTLTVTSQLGVGSTFRISLPIMPLASLESIPIAASSEAIQPD